MANQNQPLASYTYNFAGQRAQKTTPSTITQFVYDRSGHLLAESDGTTGAAQTEYLWLDDTPLALVTSGNLYFILPDHLGTPQKATDTSQNLAWDAVLRPFGTVEQQTFPPLTNLRFPGQYFDVESALHQNVFRDYDTSTGRYIESDPIGLTGGINTYAYVGGNPIKRMDPLGLIECPACQHEELDQQCLGLNEGAWGIPLTAIFGAGAIVGLYGYATTTNPLYAGLAITGAGAALMTQLFIFDMCKRCVANG